MKNNFSLQWFGFICIQVLASSPHGLCFSSLGNTQPYSHSKSKNKIHLSASPNELCNYPSAEELTEEDLEGIRIQLGYVPTNLVSISARRGGSTNTPLVLKTYPLNGGAKRRKLKAEGKLTPFPTLYWFCSKEVGTAISDLERRGYVGKLEKRLLDEPEALSLFIKSHDCYARERWDSLSDDHRNYILQKEGMLVILRDSGIAGTDYKSFLISNKPSIKCLHAHYGHYRSQLEKSLLRTESDKDDHCTGDNYDDINIVGKWVHTILQHEFPELML
mmetsp:Transcript_15262/g.17776  ORF Transcript_15262/g.17776 Transcript_15262/m.17776 type:complete len:275 (-) Transcript_15262:1004-1828(-)